MLRWALTFLIIALVAAVLGFGGIAAAAADIGRILFALFLMGYDGDTHEPKFFKLVWGTLLFKGRCTALNIGYEGRSVSPSKSNSSGYAPFCSFQ